MATHESYLPCVSECLERWLHSAEVWYTIRLWFSQKVIGQLRKKPERPPPPRARLKERESRGAFRETSREEDA